MTPQRVVVGLLDGFGPEYLAKSEMPALKRMAREGVASEVEAVFPTVSGVNNLSVCCGAWPDEHWISASSSDASSGAALRSNAAALLRAPTLFERCSVRGVRSALLTCKRTTAALLGHGASLAVTAEAPTPDVVARYGPPPDGHSPAVNHWLWTIAGDLLGTRPDLGVIYVHTSDHPMHRWGPEEPESRDHLARLDALVAAARAAAADAAFLFTANHGMNAKRRCWDLARVCTEEGVPLRLALLPERHDRAVQRRDFAGCAWLWLRSPDDATPVRDVVGALDGVEEVLDRAEAAARFRQPPERIGDLTVLGDAHTTFGEMDWGGEELTEYRAHGSLHESRVPLIVHGAERAPPRERFRVNLDLTRWLFASNGASGPSV